MTTRRPKPKPADAEQPVVTIDDGRWLRPPKEAVVDSDRGVVVVDLLG